jgi:hypothetical protein
MTLSGAWPVRFWAEPKSMCNQYYSLLHRVGGALPRPDLAVRVRVGVVDGGVDVQSDFRSFARWLVRKLVPVASADQDMTFDSWAKVCNRSAAEIQEFRKLRETVVYSDKVFTEMSFIKAESYEEEKFPRMIQGLNPLLKAFLSPVFAVVDDTLFSLKWFVKKIPVKERPGVLEELFGNDPVNSTDFSSFECHHRGLFAKLGLFWMNRILQNRVPPELKQTVARLVVGINEMTTSHLTATVRHTLMSGMLWTSSMNGFLNLAIMSYLVLRTANPNLSPERLAGRMDDFVGRVEGDDGICKGNIDPALIEGLGIKLKLAQFPHASKAAFCGIVKPPRADVVFTDPVKAMCNFFVLDGKYAESGEKTQKRLLRAKALSYYYMHRNCPIVGPLSKAVLDRTRSFTVTASDYDTYKRQVYAEMMASGKFWQLQPQITAQIRVEFEELYKMPISYQLLFEDCCVKWGRGENPVFPQHPLCDKFLHVFEESTNQRGVFDPGRVPIVVHPVCVVTPDEAFRPFDRTYHRVGLRQPRDVRRTPCPVDRFPSET